MNRPSQALRMVRRRKSAKERPAPGGPGAMAALRRAQEKLKALGIKPWKPTPPPAPKKAAAPDPAAPAPAAAPKDPASKGRPAPAKRAPAAPHPATKGRVKRTATAKSTSATRKAPTKSRR